MALLEVRDLHTSFFTDAGEVKAVNGVSFNLDRGKVLGIVGESGSGKSVTVYSIMQILAPPARSSPAPSSSTARSSSARARRSCATSAATRSRSSSRTR